MRCSRISRREVDVHLEVQASSCPSSHRSASCKYGQSADALSHVLILRPSAQVICEKADRTDIPTIDKKKYLVPSVSAQSIMGVAVGLQTMVLISFFALRHQDLTVGQFVYVIRKRIKLSPEKAIFIFVDEVLPATAALMSAIYEEHKDEDGFLYVSYSGENTFGVGSA